MRCRRRRGSGRLAAAGPRVTLLREDARNGGAGPRGEGQLLVAGIVLDDLGACEWSLFRSRLVSARAWRCATGWGKAVLRTLETGLGYGIAALSFAEGVSLEV